jgi:hypothetical protein
MPEKQLNAADLMTSRESRKAGSGLKKWAKVGMIAAASALAGGLAAAWFYRKTLNTLRNAEMEEGNSGSRISHTGTDFES